MEKSPRSRILERGGRVTARRNWPGGGERNVLYCDRDVNDRGGSTRQHHTVKRHVLQGVHVTVRKHGNIQKSPRWQCRRPSHREPQSSHRDPKTLEVIEQRVDRCLAASGVGGWRDGGWTFSYQMNKAPGSDRRQGDSSQPRCIVYLRVAVRWIVNVLTIATAEWSS